MNTPKSLIRSIIYALVFGVVVTFLISPAFADSISSDCSFNIIKSEILCKTIVTITQKGIRSCDYVLTLSPVGSYKTVFSKKETLIFSDTGVGNSSILINGTPQEIEQFKETGGNNYIVFPKISLKIETCK